MRHYEKKLDGFCVTYLHNPFECYKCVKEMGSDCDFEKTFYGFYLEKRDSSEPIPMYADASFKNFSHKNKVTSKNSTFLKPFSPTSSVKVAKKKRSSNINASSKKHSPSLSQKISKDKTSPKLHKKSSAQKSEKKSAVKKQASKSAQKNSGGKIPGKGTLKRKRWFFNQLLHKNDNYEDDLFENQRFNHFQTLLEDESDNPDNYQGIKTPVFPFSLSPRSTTPSPDYIDCYSENQLNVSRKGAEEYLYRMQKRKKSDLSEKKEKASKQVVEQESVIKVAEKFAELEEMLQAYSREQEGASDTEEDQYFSDILK